MSLQSFENIIGQKEIIDHLQNALKTGQISQAYIFNGEPGSGKGDLANAFASALQCTNRQEKDGRLEPCGKCHSCLQMKSTSHPDVITVTNELVGAELKTDTVGIKVSQFIQKDVAIKPYEGPYKIYIIPNAHRMNQQAQNALLKTLEEPPAYAVFLLLSDNTSAFLPTVLSRCVILRLRPVSEPELLNALSAEGIEGEPALIAARLSHGNPGRCLELARDQELEAFRHSLAEFLKRMPDVSSHEIIQFAGNLSPKKKDEGVNRVDDFLDMSRSWFRDLLVEKSTKKSDNLIFRDEVQYISKAAEKISFRSLEIIGEAFDEAAKRRQAKGNDVQILEVLLLKIRNAMR